MEKTTSEMQLVPIGKLVPYANNARTHSPEQVTKLRSSLREFGFINPVIIDRDYGIIAGHGRVLAAKAEGIADVPCVFVDHLTEAQKKAYILADNRYAMDAGWDEEMLRVEIEALQGMDFNIDLTGFDEAEIADLFAVDDGEAKEDDFDVDAELEKPCISQAGDVWHLGKHQTPVQATVSRDCGNVMLPRTSPIWWRNTSLPPEWRLSAIFNEVVQSSNNLGTDVFISIHCNAFNEMANGTEVWHYHTSRDGKRLAECIQRQIVDSLGTTDRGAKGAVPVNGESVYESRGLLVF